MEEMKRNIFTVGPQALERSFIGRKEQLGELESAVVYGSGSISLVGPTRIGKTSLAEALFEKNSSLDKCIQIWIDMSICQTAHQFWSCIWEELYSGLRCANAWSQAMEENYRKFANLPEYSNLWYSIMSKRLPKILVEMIKAGFRWFLVIDEFDAVGKVFGNAHYFYQFLRSLYSASYKANGIVISRRQLSELEKTNMNISTFHGVFSNMYLKGFSGEDMDEFYARLVECGITLSDEGKESLRFYTGHIPYLCCMFADRMVVRRDKRTCYGEDDVTCVFTELLPRIEEYYNDLDKRLKEDRHWESVLQLCLGSYEVLKNTRRAVSLQVMGYITRETINGVDSYFAYSRDYMEHILGKQLDVPVWDTILAGERKLKSLLGKVYPMLATATPTAANFSPVEMHRVEEACSGFRFDWNRIKKDCERSSARKGSPATILEAISLGPVVGAITASKNWSDLFSVYFYGDTTWREYKLRLISSLRDPLAHNQGHYITPEELAACSAYCKELLRLNMGPDIHA